MWIQDAFKCLLRFRNWEQNFTWGWPWTSWIGSFVSVSLRIRKLCAAWTRSVIAPLALSRLQFQTIQCVWQVGPQSARHSILNRNPSILLSSSLCGSVRFVKYVCLSFGKALHWTQTITLEWSYRTGACIFCSYGKGRSTRSSPFIFVIVESMLWLFPFTR